MEITAHILVEVVYQIGVNMNWYKKAQAYGRPRQQPYTMEWNLDDDSPWGEDEITIYYDVDPGEERSWDSPGYPASADAFKIVHKGSNQDITDAVLQWNPSYLNNLEEYLLEAAGDHDAGLADAAADMKMDQLREEGHGLI